MLSIEDRRKEKTEDFKLIKNIFLSFLYTVEFPYSKNKIIYTDRIENLKSGIVYIPEDKKLYNGFIQNIQKINDGFILNKINLNLRDFDDLFYIESNSLILKFDIFSLIHSSIYREFIYEKKEFFENINILRKKPYLEKIILNISESIKKFFLNNHGQFLELEKNKPSLNLTFDIDRNKFFNWKKDIYHYLKYVFSKDKFSKEYLNLKKSYRDKDPWDRVDEILTILEDIKMDATFYLFVKNKDIFTKRYPLSESKKIFNKVSKNNTVGLHLSYESFTDNDLIEKEIKMFKTIFKKDRIDVRFHFLNRPDKRVLKIFQKNSVRSDSSLGNRRSSGFYSGLASPFFIENDILQIPVITMDSTLYFEELKGNDHYKTISDLVEDITSINGFFTFIFHPSSLDNIFYKGFSKYLFDVIKKCKEKNFEFLSVEKIVDLYSKRKLSYKYDENFFSVDSSLNGMLKLYERNGVKILDKNFKISFKKGE